MVLLLTIQLILQILSALPEVIPLLGEQVVAAPGEQRQQVQPLTVDLEAEEQQIKLGNLL